MTDTRILVPFSEDEASIDALEYAAMLATGLDADLTAFHLADPKDYHSKADFQQELDALVSERLRPRHKDIQKKYPIMKKIDLQVRGKVRSVYDHILKYAGELEPDFVVMRSHGRPYAPDWEVRLLKSNAYKVVQGALCPVFTFLELPPRLEISNILVPLDLSHGSLYKVPLAEELARKFGATLHLISASEHSDDEAELREQLFEVSRVLKQRGVQVVKKRLKQCTMFEAIEEVTSGGDMDLVVIMSRPSFRWSDLWVSPTAKRIISQCTVPVLSVRTHKPIEIGL